MGISKTKKGSQCWSVSFSLVKMQEIKCYQRRSGTSHLKLNKTNVCMPQCQTDKTETADTEQRKEELLLTLGPVEEFLNAGMFYSCTSAHVRMCVCVLCTHVVFVFYKCLCSSTEAHRALKLLTACRCWLSIEKHFKA